LPVENKTSEEDLNGGSGGYVYINTTNIFGENYLSTGATISARGGHGKNKGYGGSGGVIVFGKNFKLGTFNVTNVRADGGLAGSDHWSDRPRGCGNAAAGTAYFWSSDRMRVDN